MSIPLVVAGETFEYPESGDSPSWGAEATDWASAVTDVLSTVVGTGDILLTSATIANNTAVAANINGLAFDPGTVRSAIITYSIYRVTTGVGAMEAVETGQIFAGYLSTANEWDISVIGGQGAGVTFSVLANGQFQYTSTNFTGSGYSGIIKFKATAIPQ